MFGPCPYGDNASRTDHHYAPRWKVFLELLILLAQRIPSTIRLEFHRDGTSQMSTLADKIKALRIERGLSQRELASLIGVTPAAVSNWEVGARENIKGEALLSLASALGVAPEELLVRSQPPEAVPADELQLLAAYRQLPPEHKKIAVHLVKALKHSV